MRRERKEVVGGFVGGWLGGSDAGCVWAGESCARSVVVEEVDGRAKLWGRERGVCTWYISYTPSNGSGHAGLRQA